MAIEQGRIPRIDLEGDGKLGYGFTSADELEEIEKVKKEIKKLLDAGFIRPCRYAEGISNEGLRGCIATPTTTDPILGSYLGATVALVITVVAAVGAFRRLIAAAATTRGRTLIVLIFLASTSVVVVTKVARPRAETLPGSSEEVLSSLLFFFPSPPRRRRNRPVVDRCRLSPPIP
ncbi:hypothetical protein QYE76_058092 [Lolium multiflorum]|uniref:Uncharacterized protein n=1 Tax=Lolium multiflorum TaxID=4521 RepID=A0AAD8T6E8_LOLMU|nr:hypothetical protein QYE76_058092 [Lolium multiflorum]